MLSTIPRLCAGGTIGVCSPSSPGPLMKPEEWNASLALFRDQGFNIKLGNLTQRPLHQGFRFASPQSRAEELMSLILDPQVVCVIPSMGGLHASSIIPFLDFSLIHANPKIICGFGDFCAVQVAINKLSGVPSLHTPSFIAFASASNFTLDQFYRISSSFVRGNINLNELSGRFGDSTWKPLRSGCATGKLLTIETSTLLSLAGTRYWPNLEGAILVLEERDAIFSIAEKHFGQLKQIGVFEQIAALIIAKPVGLMPQNAPFSFYELIEECVGNRKIPIIANFDAGHTENMIPLPQFRSATLMVEKGFGYSLILIEPSVF